jgi:serine phosphatase RsbU (regulator of sigma subunit)
MRRSIFFLIFLFLISSTSAQTPVELKNGQNIYQIGKSISYLRDSSGKLSFDDILAEKIKFIPSNKKELNFGYTNDFLWLKFTLNNQSDFDDWVFDVKANNIGYFDFYYQEENGTWKKSETGTALPFSSKQISDTGNAFFLKFEDKAQKTFYFRCQAKVGLIIPPRVQRYESFNNYSRMKNFYYGGYFGILLVMILYNLFIYLTLRDKNYLYYVFTIITTLGLFSSITGYNYMFFWADMPVLNIISARIFTSLIVITTAVFTIYFLQLKKYSHFLYYWMLLNIVLAILAAILELLTPWKALTSNLISIHIITMIASGVVTWRKGNSLGKYYLFAWLLYALGGAMITLRNAGVLPSNMVTRHAVEVGSILEVIIISFALSAKYGVLKRENDRATKKALHFQKKANEELENKVHERTTELQSTLDTVSKQNIDIEKKNNNISASINYASRIQEAFLAINSDVKEVLPEYFIFFKPRDVVSGDFYFFAKKDDKIIIAAADCTGHGIPGAMMSMIGQAYLSEIVHFLEILSVDKILSELHYKIRAALLQDDENYAVADGMDISICLIDKAKKIVEFAGAKNPLIYIQNNELHHIKGTRQSIGGKREGRGTHSFEKHTVAIDTETSIYLFTDGFQDQFGGEEDTKFMIKNLKSLFLENYTKPPEEQKQQLEETFTNWKRGTRQIDDVLVVGFKLDKDFLA